MPNKQKGMRGDNSISKTLNKKIQGPLAQKKSKKFIFIFLGSTFLAIWIIAINKLGFQSGSIITVVLVFGFIFSVICTKWQVKETKKHKWKAFDDDK